MKAESHNDLTVGLEVHNSVVVVTNYNNKSIINAYLGGIPLISIENCCCDLGKAQNDLVDVCLVFLQQMHLHLDK